MRAYSKTHLVWGKNIWRKIFQSTITEKTGRKLGQRSWNQWWLGKGKRNEGKISILKNERMKQDRLPGKWKLKTCEVVIVLLCFKKKIEIEISGNENAINQQISLFCWGHKRNLFYVLINYFRKIRNFL